MKTNVNRSRYPDLDKAVAFKIAFEPMVHLYGSMAHCEIDSIDCESCNYKTQVVDFLTPKGPCSKLDRAILSSYHYGVSIAVHDLLIEHFDDITESDFRPCRSKSGEIVFYQITPQHKLPPMAEELDLRETAPCPQCGRTHFLSTVNRNTQGYPYFEITELAVNMAHSLNVTHEQFEGYYHTLVISRKVYDFLSDRYPRMEFQPMFLKK